MAAAPLLVAAALCAGAAVGLDHRHDVLTELRDRGVIAKDVDAFKPEDEALLGRMRHAERVGALEFLNKRLRGLRGVAASFRAPDEKEPHLHLTKAAFDRYLLLRTQDALAYFDAKGTEIKWAYNLRDLDGKPLFDPSGLLSSAGEDLYARAAAGLEAYWQTPYGEVLGNRPPKPKAPAAKAFPQGGRDGGPPGREKAPPPVQSP